MDSVRDAADSRPNGLYTFGSRGYATTREGLNLQFKVLLLFIGIVYIVLMILNWKFAEDRKKASASTMASYFQYEPYNHGRTEYDYQVNGRRYVGAIDGGERLILGKTFLIHYDPTYPEHSYSDNPNLIDKCLVTSLSTLCVTGCIVGAYFLSARKLNASPKMSHEEGKVGPDADPPKL